MKLFLLVFLIFLKEVSSVATTRPITHEDIRDAILSMVHMFRDATDKLERHELRERQLGDQLKKALSSLDKRGRAQDHILNGVNNKLMTIEDRLKKIESNLQQEDGSKEKYTIDTVPLQSWMSNVEGILNRQSVSNELMPSKDKLDAMEAAYNSKMDYVASLIEKLQSEILTSSAKMSAMFEQQREHHSIDHKKWHGSLLSQIELQSHKLANMHTINDINNGSFSDEIRAAKDDIISIVNSGLNGVENKLTQLDYSLHNEEENMVDAVAKSRDMMEDYFRQVHEKFLALSDDVNALEKVEKILIQTDENVLDTKRKIEFMMFQVIKGVEESIALQSKDVNETMTNRFNSLSDVINEHLNVSIGNISNKIETEMGQVWRQIGILYTQLTESAAVLNDLQNQTKHYVNQSTEKMEKMDSNIESINTHVAEIQDNVNYFMGRLSLVTQEFNQTRNALAIIVDTLNLDVDKPREDHKYLGPLPSSIDSRHDPNLDNRL